MSSLQIDLGNSILHQLEEENNAAKKKKQGSNKNSKKTDQSKRDKLGSEIDLSKRDKSAGTSKNKSRKLKPITSNARSDGDKLATSVIESQKPPKSKRKSNQHEGSNGEKEVEDSDASTLNEHEIMLEEIKKLGGTQEDLELISFSASEEEEIHEDSEVDPKLVHDLKDFMKDLNFSAVMGQCIKEEQKQSNSVGPAKTDQQPKPSNTLKKRKKNTTNTESCSSPSTTHPKREKKKKRSQP